MYRCMSTKVPIQLLAPYHKDWKMHRWYDYLTSSPFPDSQHNAWLVHLKLPTLFSGTQKGKRCHDVAMVTWYSKMHPGHSLVLVLWQLIFSIHTFSSDPNAVSVYQFHSTRAYYAPGNASQLPCTSQTLCNSPTEFASSLLENSLMSLLI